MDSDNNPSDSEPNSNSASSADTSSRIRTGNTSDNDSVKSHSRDSSPRAAPQSPMPDEEVADGPQSPTSSSSRSNSVSRSMPGSPQGPESPPGEPGSKTPPSASANGGGDAASEGDDGSASSSSSSEGRKPGSVNRSRSSSRGSRQARRQANLDDGITTSEEESDAEDSAVESSRSSGSNISGKDLRDKGDRSSDSHRRLRSPPPRSEDVQPEAISDGDMESDNSDDDKPPSPKSLDSQPPKSPPKDTKIEPVTQQHLIKDLSLTHDDLSDVSDLDDDDSMGGHDTDKLLLDRESDSGGEGDGKVEGRLVRKGDDKLGGGKDGGGIQSPVGDLNRDGGCKLASPLRERKNDKPSESNTTTIKTLHTPLPPQPPPTTKIPHPRIVSHDNNNGDDNEEEQLDFEAEEGEQPDQEELSETHKDNTDTTNRQKEQSTLDKTVKRLNINADDKDKLSSRQQKLALLPTPPSGGECVKNDSGGGGSTTNGKVAVKEPIELEEGEVSDEDEARPEETEPRPVCRFFSRGQCTWGASCRFLHPGVTDKGHYSMFEVVRPTLLSEFGTVPGPGGRPPSLMDDPRMGGQHGGHQQPPIESAWERGLRTAKEMLRKSIKRKEQDMDFEEKKMNLTLAQQQDEEVLREAENGGGYYISGGRTSASSVPIRERESSTDYPPPVSSRHRVSAEVRDREMDAVYGREAAIRMDQQRQMDQRHLERLERMDHPQAHRAHGGGGGVMVAEHHVRRRADDGLTPEEYYQHQAARSARYQAQVVPHHFIYQEEYSGVSQRGIIHPGSSRSYSRHPSDLAPPLQHHPAAHLAPPSYRDHRPDYFHDQRSQSAKYMHATSPIDGGDAVLVTERGDIVGTAREGGGSRSRGTAARREVIVQRAEVVVEQHQQQLQQQQQQQVQRERTVDGYRVARHGGVAQMGGTRPDEWADPWMRSKSPGGGRSTGVAGKGSKSGKKRSYSSASSYSSSSNSSSRSRSSSRSSTRSSLRSRSRSPHGHHVTVPRHHGSRSGRGGRQVVSPSVIVSERKAANERAAAMNPPAPRRSNKAPSPGMMRAGAQNPPAPHQPPAPPPVQSTTASSRNKLVLAAAVLERVKHQRVAAVAAAVAATGARARGSSSGSSSAGSSSDSDSSTGSSSSAASGSSGASRGRGGRSHRISASGNVAVSGAPSGGGNRNLAIGLALKAKAMDVLKSGGNEKRGIKLNLKAPLGSSGSSGGSKKRPAPISPTSGAGAAGAGPDAKKKGSSSRREELLKQLKAVEDAIAKKRSKV